MLWYLHNDAWVYGINSDFNINSLMICDENDNCDNCDLVDQQSTVHYQNIVDSIKEFEMMALIEQSKSMILIH